VCVVVYLVVIPYIRVSSSHNMNKGRQNNIKKESDVWFRQG
jgi:hypothetical protein